MVDCLEICMKNKEDFIQFLNIVRDNPNIYEMQKFENTIYLHSNNIEKVQRDVMQGLINQNLYVLVNSKSSFFVNAKYALILLPP